MADSSLLQLIKRIVKETVDAEKPCDYFVGKVVSAKPLKIRVSASLTLDADFMDLARSVTDYKMNVQIEGLYSGEITVRDALQMGEKVLMVRKHRGQRYAVIDRMVSE